jgi:hypothetical protein
MNYLLATLRFAAFLNRKASSALATARYEICNGSLRLQQPDRHDLTMKYRCSNRTVLWWLCNRITYYEQETLFLKTMAHFRGEGLRPRIEMEATNHGLAVDQRTSITLQKAWDIVHYYSDSDEKGV